LAFSELRFSPNWKLSGRFDRHQEIKRVAQSWIDNMAIALLHRRTPTMKTAHDPNGVMRRLVVMIAVRLRSDVFITPHPLPFI
jgi:aspartate aminotransferase-like enzyme